MSSQELQQQSQLPAPALESSQEAPTSEPVGPQDWSAQGLDPWSAAQMQGTSGNAAVAALVADSGPPAGGTSNDDLDLLRGPAEELADACWTAARTADMPTVYRTLGGDNVDVKDAFEASYGYTVEQHLDDNLDGADLLWALGFAEHGRVTLTALLHQACVGLYADEDMVVEVIEEASPSDLYEVANDPEALGWISQALANNPRYQARVQVRLDPYVDRGEADPERFTEEVAAEQEGIEAKIARLLPMLGTNKGTFNDDEDGMLATLGAWSVDAGPVTMDLPGMAEVDSFLKGELSDRQYTEAIHVLTTGNQRSIADKIEEARQGETLGIADWDEEACYQALVDATPEQRAAYKADPEAWATLLETVGGGDFGPARAEALLLPVGIAQAGAFNQLLAAVAPWASPVVKDSDMFGWLEGMATLQLVFLRETGLLYDEVIERFNSNEQAQAFKAMLGLGRFDQPGDAAPDVNALAGDATRLLGRLLAATPDTSIGMVIDADAVFETIVDWKIANADLEGPLDQTGDPWTSIRSRMTAIRTQLPSIGSRLFGAVFEGQPLTEKDRLEFATTTQLGTDEEAVTDSIASVTDEELLRSWSNLGAYKAAWLANDDPLAREDLRATFVPDLGPDVQGMIRGDYTNPTVPMAAARDRLATALMTPAGYEIASSEFHYEVSERALVELRLNQSQEELEANSGGLGGDPREAEARQGEFAGEARDVFESEEGTEEEREELDQAEEARQAFNEAEQEYVAAKQALAMIASTLAALVVGGVVTIASGGAATSLTLAMIQAMAPSVASELTKAAFEGGVYDFEAGAETLASTFATALLTYPVETVAKPLRQGLGNKVGGSEAWKGFAERFPWLAPGVKARAGELATSLSGYPAKAATTAFDPGGLLQEGLGAVVPDLSSDSFKKELRGLLTAFMTDHAKFTDASIAKIAKEWGAEARSEQLKMLVVNGTIDLTAATASGAVLAGRVPSELELMVLLGKLTIKGLSSAQKVNNTANDLSQILWFFNNASEAELVGLRSYVDADVADRVLESRGAVGSFTNLQQIYNIVPLKHAVLPQECADIQEQVLVLMNR